MQLSELLPDFKILRKFSKYKLSSSMLDLRELFLLACILAFSISGISQGEILVFSDKPQYDNQRYTKFEALCFENGLRTKHIASYKYYSSPVVQITGKPEGVIYDCWKINDQNLSKLYNYVKNGGNLILFYSGVWSKNNYLFQELFNISFIAENLVIQKSSGAYSFPAGSGSPILGSHKIGIITGYDQCTLPCCVSTLSPGRKGTMYSNSSGKTRTIAFEYEIGDGKVFLFPTIFGTSSATPHYGPLDGSYVMFPDSFICDRQLNNFENEAAALELINWIKQ
jgi:hypothetical protein